MRCNNNKIKLLSILFLFSIFNATPGMAEKNKQDRSYSGYEFSYAAGIIRLREDDLFTNSYQFFLMKRGTTNGVRNKVSFGIGLESLSPDDEHYTFMFALAVHPWRNLTIRFAPGVQYARHLGKSETGYAAHFQINYRFERGPYYFGPFIGYSNAKNDTHYSVGIQGGFDL